IPGSGLCQDLPTLFVDSRGITGLELGAHQTALILFLPPFVLRYGFPLRRRDLNIRILQTPHKILIRHPYTERGQAVIAEVVDLAVHQADPVIRVFRAVPRDTDDDINATRPPRRTQDDVADLKSHGLPLTAAEDCRNLLRLISKGPRCSPA